MNIIKCHTFVASENKYVHMSAFTCIAVHTHVTYMHTHMYMIVLKALLQGGA